MKIRTTIDFLIFIYNSWNILIKNKIIIIITIILVIIIIIIIEEKEEQIIIIEGEQE